MRFLPSYSLHATTPRGIPAILMNPVTMLWSPLLLLSTNSPSSDSSDNIALASPRLSSMSSQLRLSSSSLTSSISGMKLLLDGRMPTILRMFFTISSHSKVPSSDASTYGLSPIALLTTLCGLTNMLPLSFSMKTKSASCAAIDIPPPHWPITATICGMICDASDSRLYSFAN